MEHQGLLTKAIVVVAFAVFLSLIWVVLEQAGVRQVLVIGWTAAIGLLVVWLVSIVGWLSHAAGRACLVASLALMVLCVLGSQNIIQEVFPYCGDGVCAPGECMRECSDCSAEVCRDGYCQLAFETCREADCACSGDMVCAPGRNDSDERGCAPALCGDGRCDAPVESPLSCCRDCGCQPDYACEANVCYFQPPRITFVPYILSEAVSASSLAANPMLTDAAGRPHPLFAISLRNDVTEAGYVNVRFELPGFLTENVSLGFLPPGAERNLTWYLRHEPSFLQVRQPRRVNLTLAISYLDRQGVSHASTWHYPFTILPRSVIDEYGSVAFLVMPADVPVSALDARGVWAELQQLVQLGADRGAQLPAETIERGEGSARDLALVLASGFVRAGLRTSLVETSGGLLVRVLDGERYVMLDPARLSGSYGEAIVQWPGHAVHEIEQVWLQRNATVLSVE